MALATGQVINNRYRIVELLGEGGFGAVYKALDINLDITVAIKENFSANDPSSFRQFAREANLLASLRHPNLPKVTDYFMIPERGQYLVMEYIEGEDLNEKLERSGCPLPEDQVMLWFDQILSALEYLHSQTTPIIHRDIKPENIRVTPRGQAVLVDFGIAKVNEGDKRTTQGARAVTPGYSPFEQYGQAPTDARSDVYAAGATMYTVLTGQTPPESIQRLVDDPLEPPRLLNPSLSPQVEQVILRALAIDPRNRWQSAADLRAALKEAAGSISVQFVQANHSSQSLEGGVIAPTLQIPLEEHDLPQIQKMEERIEKAKRLEENKSSNSRTLWLIILATGGTCIIGVAALIVLSVVFYGSFNPNLLGMKSSPTTAASATSTQVLYVAQPTTPKPITMPLRMGLLAPLSGAVPTFGLSTKEGAELAVKEWNAKGGVLGRQIELIVADSQCSADPAVNAANKLIDQDGVKYIIGEVCSSASIPVSEIVNQKGVVQISPTSTNPAVTVDKDGKTKPYTFRACFIDPFQGLVMAKFAQSKGYKTAFIIFDQGNDYVRGLAEAFEKAFTDLGGQIVGKETYTSSDTDFSAILTKVNESKAEVLYIPDYYNIVNLVGAQAKDKGVTAVMMGGDGWDSADLDVAAADGGFYSNHYDAGDTRPIVVEWLKKYGAEFKDANGNPKVPDALATLAYDAANLLFAAIEKAGVDDPAKVAEALAGLTWEGVSGKITFDAQHNPIKSAAVIGVSGGKKEFVESVAP